jgi:hypothetical protein
LKSGILKQPLPQILLEIPGEIQGQEGEDSFSAQREFNRKATKAEEVR